MTRRDESRTSLVDFLRSLKFSRKSKKTDQNESGTRFARLEQHILPRRAVSGEELQLVRSAN